MAQLPFDASVQNNFPISSVIDAYTRQAQLKQQADQFGQQSLVQGLKDIGSVGESLYNRRQQIAQSLAQSQLYQKMHPELFTPQTVVDPNQPTLANGPQGPVTPGQTASYDPTSGSLTPNSPQMKVNPPLMSAQDTQSLPTALLGLSPKDLLDSYAQGQAAKTNQGRLALEQQYKPQELALENRRAAAEEENNRMQRLFQGLLAGNTVKNDALQRSEAEKKEKIEGAKAILSSGSPLNPFNPVTFAQKKAALAVLADQNNNSYSLPSVGQTVTHPSGVKITRVK